MRFRFESAPLNFPSKRAQCVSRHCRLSRNILRRRWAWPFDAVVDLGHGDFNSQAADLCDGLQSRAGLDRPGAVRLPQEALEVWPVLRNEDVLLERVDLPVLRELFATVVGFGGGGEDFDDDPGIKDAVPLGILQVELKRTANN